MLAVTIKWDRAAFTERWTPSAYLSPARNMPALLTSPSGASRDVPAFEFYGCPKKK